MQTQRRPWHNDEVTVPLQAHYGNDAGSKAGSGGETDSTHERRDSLSCNGFQMEHHQQMAGDSTAFVQAPADGVPTKYMGWIWRVCALTCHR